MSKNVAVITGGAGFIGSHLCDRFLEKGFKVLAVDNFLTGNTQNIDHLKAQPDFSLIEQDVTKPFQIAGPVHAILHFASPASPLDYTQYPIQTLKVGALGTHNSLGLARAKRAIFLLASTSEVYGDPLVHPQNEDYWGNVNPIGPRGVYDEAKRFAETITMAYHHFHKMNVKIARIFNTYGPRMRLKDGRAIPEFIRCALQDKPLPVFGRGSQTRSFCYIEDMVDAVEKLVFSNLNEPINLGNPNEMTILELAQAILGLIKSKSKIEYHPLPPDDPKVRQPDITRARTKLGWQPKVDLQTGLLKTIDYFKKCLSVLK